MLEVRETTWFKHWAPWVIMTSSRRSFLNSLEETQPIEGGVGLLCNFCVCVSFRMVEAKRRMWALDKEKWEFLVFVNLSLTVTLSANGPQRSKKFES